MNINRYGIRQFVIATIILVITLTILGISWLTESMKQSSTVETLAITRMKEQTPLTQVTRIDRFNGDESWMIIWGIDHVNRPVVGWIRDQDVEVEMAEFLPTHQWIYEQFIKEQPLAQVIRVSPAIIHGVKTWEVFYKMSAPRGQAYRYAYYKWKNGDPVEQYRLAVMD